MNMLSVRNLGFSYGDHRVLEHIGFTADSREMLFVLGPNGVGKSTLFRCILGQLIPQTGDIRIEGHAVSSLSIKERSRKIAYIPQIMIPPYDYTVLQMVLMGRTSHLSPFANPSGNDRSIAMDALDTLKIAHLAQKGIKEISGGEQQLTYIAMALAQQSRMLIMDEPTSNLDYGNQMRVMERMQAIRDQGLLILLSSHNPQQALLFADRVLMMGRNETLEDGKPRDVVTAKAIHDLYDVDVEMVDHHATRIIVPHLQRQQDGFWQEQAR